MMTFFEQSLPSPTINRRLAGPRKRRRRATTSGGNGAGGAGSGSGAADDCFACRRKHIKCDRRRPYCSQCQGEGKECSGYKTQLTWGVGVASRGKLRGLTLPIPKNSGPSPGAGGDGALQSSSSQSPSGRRRQVSVDTPRSARTVPETDAVSVSDVASVSSSSISPPSGHQDRFIGFNNSSQVRKTSIAPVRGNQQQILRPTNQWATAPYSCPLPGATVPGHGGDRSAHPVPLRIEPVSALHDDFGLSVSSGSISDFASQSPVDYPETPDDMAFLSGVQPAASTMAAASTSGSFQNRQTPFLDCGPATQLELLGEPAYNDLNASLAALPSHYQMGTQMHFPPRTGGPQSMPPPHSLGPCNLGDTLNDHQIAEARAYHTQDIELSFGYRLLRPRSFDPQGNTFVVDM